MATDEFQVIDRRTTNFIMKCHTYVDYWLPFLVNQQAGVNDIYDILLRFVNRQQGHPLEGHSWPSYTELCKRAGGVGRTKVANCLKLLAQWGLIQIDKDPDTSHNIYTILDVPNPPQEVLNYLGIDVKKEKKQIEEKILKSLPKTPVKKQAPPHEAPIRRRMPNEPKELLNFWLGEYEKILGIKPANLNKKETIKNLSILKSLLQAYDGNVEYLKKLITFFIENFGNISGYKGDIPTLAGLAGFKNAVALKMKKDTSAGRKILKL
jgi:hypothetical protein